ncbi:MAG: hypothetical protein BMS9Abin28_1998 [Anaerolineae bacterium]|nr:MAG: hypothetical protein BMS9Abin28_1998 [Anaerolineae bacterium]
MKQNPNIRLWLYRLDHRTDIPGRLMRPKARALDPTRLIPQREWAQSKEHYRRAKLGQLDALRSSLVPCCL